MARSAYEFLESYQGQVVGVLAKNESVSAFVQALLEHLVHYANHVGVRVEDVVLEAPFVGDDEYVRARIRVKR